jgi:CDP-glucose 4,6-dehydratase
LKFYKDKNVFITGHTGFKGTWLSFLLDNMGANVYGYSLAPNTQPNLFNLTSIKENINSFFGDIRDLKNLKSIFNQIDPEIVIHMAAQPLVRESYNDPVYTYETNVMGTVNILECIKDSNVKSFLNVTTDKVYENKEWFWPYRENETLCGHDPYSNSKSCSELVTFSYKNSFFDDDNVSISTARSGNVIGGGDFSKDRIIPDCVEAAKKNELINVRNPNSIRPYQHVLECLHGYLLLVQKQYDNKDFEGSYNFGPNEESSISTGVLVNKFCEEWGEGISWTSTSDNGPHESNFLKLDSSKAKNVLGWKPKWNIDIALEKVVKWTKNYFNEKNIIECMNNQIIEYYDY